MTPNHNRCPVCGTQAPADILRTPNCPSCGTKYAFVEYFAGLDAFDAWKKLITEAWRNQQVQKLDVFRNRARLIVGPEYLAFHDTAKGNLTIIDRFGHVRKENNVRDYSVSNMRQVILSTTGTVSVTGNTDGGHYRANGISGIRAVLAAATCTHLVDEQGRVSSYGTCEFRQQLEQWRGIRQLACDNSHMVGLTASGTVVQCFGNDSGRNSAETAGWKNITNIAAASGYTLALNKDGQVFYAGPNENMRREIAAWRNITAIAADSQYAIGLTKDGKVLMSGECISFLDGGRSDARNWTNIACIAAGHSVISAVTNTGELLIAGCFVRSQTVIDTFRKNSPTDL